MMPKDFEGLPRSSAEKHRNSWSLITRFESEPENRLQGRPTEKQHNKTIENENKFFDALRINCEGRRNIEIIDRVVEREISRHSTDNQSISSLAHTETEKM